jgi:hypothetical protein
MENKRRKRKKRWKQCNRRLIIMQERSKIITKWKTYFVVYSVALGGVMLIVLAIGPKVHGFRHLEERCILKGAKNPWHDIFRWGVKPSAPCRKFLQHVEDPLTYNRDTDVEDPLTYDRDTDRQNSAAISRPTSPHFATRRLCCYQNRELQWMYREWLQLR